MVAENGYTIRTLRSMEDLESVQDAWRALQTHPNTDYDFYRLIVAARSEVIGPYVLVLSRGDQVEAILVGRLENVRMECRLGYKVICRPRARVLTIVHGGLMGQDDSETATILVGALQAALRQKEADYIYVSSIDSRTHFFQATRTLTDWICRHPVVSMSPHYYINLPGSLEEFLAKLRSKHRYWLRRMRRILEEEYP